MYKGSFVKANVQLNLLNERLNEKQQPTSHPIILVYTNVLPIVVVQSPLLYRKVGQNIEAILLRGPTIQ